MPCIAMLPLACRWMSSNLTIAMMPCRYGKGRSELVRGAPRSASHALFVRLQVPCAGLTSGRQHRSRRPEHTGTRRGACRNAYRLAALSEAAPLAGPAARRAPSRTLSQQMSSCPLADPPVLLHCGSVLFCNNASAAALALRSNMQSLSIVQRDGKDTTGSVYRP